MEAIEAMRRRGFAVVVFAPHELGSVDRQRFEERLDDMGYDLLGDMEPEEEWIWGPDECPEVLEHTNRGL